MKIRPTLKEVEELAAEGKYKTVPLSCEILSDFITPIEAMRILKNVSSHCFMLESAQADEKWGRYTFLGYDPLTSVTCSRGRMKIGDVEVETDDPSVYLREMLAEHVSPRSDDLPPFTGGLVGYFSYDYLGYAEPSVRCDVEDTEDFKDVDLMLFDKVIAFDNLRQVIVLIADMQLAEGETGYNKAALELKHMAELLREGKKIREPAGRLKGPVTPLFDRLADAARERVAANKAKRPLADVRRAAIRMLSPYAVDVSSGIESNGIKDEKKMAAFVAAVRQENDIT